MNVSLTPQLEALVQRKVESGLYGSASEVMREALRLLEERDRLRSMRLEALRAEIQQGWTVVNRHRWTWALLRLAGANGSPLSGRKPSPHASGAETPTG